MVLSLLATFPDPKCFPDMKKRIKISKGPISILVFSVFLALNCKTANAQEAAVAGRVLAGVRVATSCSTPLTAAVNCVGGFLFVLYTLREHPNFNPNTMCLHADQFGRMLRSCQSAESAFGDMPDGDRSDPMPKTGLVGETWLEIYQLDRRLGRARVGMVPGRACTGGTESTTGHDEVQSCVSRLKDQWVRATGQRAF